MSGETFTAIVEKDGNRSFVTLPFDPDDHSIEAVCRKPAVA